MRGVAKATIMGNLTGDPEVREFDTDNGPIKKAEFSVAVNKRDDKVLFARCEAWGKLAEIVVMAKKGEPVYVESEIEDHEYQDKNGVDRKITKYRAREFRFLGGKREE